MSQPMIVKVSKKEHRRIREGKANVTSALDKQGLAASAGEVVVVVAKKSKREKLDDAERKFNKRQRQMRGW